MLHAARSFLFVDMRALLRIALHIEITLLLVAYLKNYFDHDLNVQLVLIIARVPWPKVWPKVDCGCIFWPRMRSSACVGWLSTLSTSDSRIILNAFFSIISFSFSFNSRGQGFYKTAACLTMQLRGSHTNTIAQ